MQPASGTASVSRKSPRRVQRAVGHVAGLSPDVVAGSQTRLKARLPLRALLLSPSPRSRRLRLSRFQVKVISHIAASGVPHGQKG